MARQDEKQRLRRRLQDYAVQLATQNRWGEAVEANRQHLELGEDPSTYNRLGKAYSEQGLYNEALDAYQQTLRLNPTNTIARRNVARIESLLTRGITELPPNRDKRQQVDLRLFITEASKTMITNLVDVPRTHAVEALTTGERLDLQVSGNYVEVTDIDGEVIGRVEPKIGQRLAQLITGGNRYIAAIVQSDARQVRILIREIYQDPGQQGRTSFPRRLVDSGMYEYLTTRYDYELEAEELLEEDTPEVAEMMSEEYSSDEESEEIGLEDIEKNISDDEDENEEE